MSEREAIENLKGCVVSYEIDEHGRPNGNVTADLTMEIINLAISALEKQEKKPAKAKFNKRYNKFVYFCPVCGEVTGHYDYCSDCGQAIDYDNPEPYTEEEE
jgi:hypothetical protein